jgi:hypothetical protein
LVDKEKKIMGEVGTNGTCSNSIRAFMKRVFNFQLNYELDNRREWRYWYLNYNLDLFKVELTDEAYKIIEDDWSNRTERLREAVNEAAQNWE